MERHCNGAAAEFLIPTALLRTLWQTFERSSDPFRAAAGRFNVSRVAAARRAKELGLVDDARFFIYVAGLPGRPAKDRAGGGGNFYATHRVRLGRRFSEAVVAATRAGDLLYTDAYSLTDLRGGTFDKFADRVGEDTHVG